MRPSRMVGKIPQRIHRYARDLEMPSLRATSGPVIRSFLVACCVMLDRIDLDAGNGEAVDYGLTMVNLSERLKWELAGFVNEDGDLGRPVQSDAVLVPDNLAVEGEMLTWKVSPQPPHRWVRGEGKMLSDFLSLARTKRGEKVLSFAQKWGVLGLAEVVFKAPSFPNELAIGGKRFLVSDGLSSIRGELWINYIEIAKRVAALVNVAAELTSPPQRIGSKENWATLGVDWDDLHGVSEPIKDAEFLLYLEVNDWLELGRVGLRLGWDNRNKWRTSVSFGSDHTILGPLALQLLLVLSRSDSLYACSGCGLPYVRFRKRPKLGCNNYCEDCGIKQALRDADDRRRKKNRARRLYKEGKSVPVIARQLGGSEVRIRDWVSKAAR